MERLIHKTSTILIAVGDSLKLYRSRKEIPPRLRRKLAESTSSGNSGIILIADEKGKEEILRSLRGLPPEVQSRLEPIVARKRRKKGREPARLIFGLAPLDWMEIVLVAGAGVLFCLLIALK